MNDIEQWTKNKRGGPCPVCDLPADVLDNLDYGWHKLGLRERALYAYLSDRGKLPDDATLSRHFIKKHYKEDHVRGQ
jgi:hypothetical protein